MISWKYSDSKVCNSVENGEGDVPVASKSLIELVNGDFHGNGMFMVL